MLVFTQQAIGLGREMTNWYYLHLKWNPFIPEGTEKVIVESLWMFGVFVDMFVARSRDHLMQSLRIQRRLGSTEALTY